MYENLPVLAVLRGYADTSVAPEPPTKSCRKDMRRRLEELSDLEEEAPTNVSRDLLLRMCRNCAECWMGRLLVIAQPQQPNQRGGATS
jgi:hypothetical protein